MYDKGFLELCKGVIVRFVLDFDGCSGEPVMNWSGVGMFVMSVMDMVGCCEDSLEGGL